MRGGCWDQRNTYNDKHLDDYIHKSQRGLKSVSRWIRFCPAHVQIFKLHNVNHHFHALWHSLMTNSYSSHTFEIYYSKLMVGLASRGVYILFIQSGVRIKSSMWWRIIASHMGHFLRHLTSHTTNLARFETGLFYFDQEIKWICLWGHWKELCMSWKATMDVQIEESEWGGPPQHLWEA